MVCVKSLIGHNLKLGAIESSINHSLFGLFLFLYRSYEF